MKKTFKNFMKELESVKTIPFPITTEEEWYGYYQHSDSETAGYLEDGEDLMSPEEYAEENNVFHETDIFDLDGDGIIDPTKEIEQGRVVESGTSDWTLEDFLDYMSASQFTCGSEDTLSEAIYQVITCAPVGVHDDDSLLTQTIEDYPDSKLLWYNNYDIKGLDHYPDYPKEIQDIIEKYVDFEDE